MYLTLSQTLSIICIVLGVFAALSLVLFWIACLISERNELKKEIAELKAKEERRKELAEFKRQLILAPKPLTDEAYKELQDGTFIRVNE